VPIHENLRVVAYMAKHDPLAILGFCLLGAGAVLFSHMQIKMSRAGISAVVWRGMLANYRLHAEYSKVRKEHGWSPWPAYLVWPCFALGIAALFAGSVLLQN
jgi:hypothetical protein